MAAAARGRAAATAPLGIDALGLQQELDGLGLGADRGAAGLRLSEDRRRLRHDARDLRQEPDLVAKLAFAVGQLANRGSELINSLGEAFLPPRELIALE